MPLIDIKCPNCNLVAERLVKFHDGSTDIKSVPCTCCNTYMTNADVVKETQYKTNFVLKGDGWFNSEGGY
jgi:phage FluMu protein Com